ncbi:glycosyltransferase family 2 protein [Luteolibacter yonseiensis]|uniref:Glycosyltransferase family 2 protein n=1 Tax=Luteolibacter yonseiensis TaxID=1144680 RepID=A0A934R6H0_9BACT|nr:glycosyltransferase [Luteolibacter yonseiensis]MBK1817126.1 glycosyltransferase family 2 protein [Luteolibacter yonseiensis]
MLKVSVLLCTHNPKDGYITRTLEALKDQTLPRDQWELMLIDNSSADPLAGRYDLSWHPNGRHLLEKELGLTPARMCGIANASSELLVFVDDDNVLRPDYLAKAVEIAEKHPFLGAWGGNTKGVYEVTPPEWFGKWAEYIGVKKHDRFNWTNVPCNAKCSPIGAGLCVRRAVAVAYAEEQKNSDELKLDRCGDLLLGCGDLDLAYHSVKLDMGYAVTPELELDHLIPAGRLTEEYLERLVDQTMFSGAFLQFKWGQIDKSFSPPGWKSRQLKRWRNRGKSAIDRKLNEAIDRGYARGRLMLGSGMTQQAFLALQAGGKK